MNARKHGKLIFILLVVLSLAAGCSRQQETASLPNGNTPEQTASPASTAEVIQLLEPKGFDLKVPQEAEEVVAMIMGDVKPSDAWSDFGDKMDKVAGAPVISVYGPKNLGTIDGWYIVPRQVVLIADVVKSDIPTDKVTFVLGTPFTDNCADFEGVRDPQGDTDTTERWIYSFDSGAEPLELAGFVIATNKNGEGWSHDFAMIHGAIPEDLAVEFK